jgi:hypothetical protein
MADGSDRMMLTVHLKHQKDKNLAEINAKLHATGFWKRFPPPGTEVVSWYVMMGIGQVVTLSLPPGKLREVNLAIEQCAWGGVRYRVPSDLRFPHGVGTDQGREGRLSGRESEVARSITRHRGAPKKLKTGRPEPPVSKRLGGVAIDDREEAAPACPNRLPRPPRTPFSASSWRRPSWWPSSPGPSSPSSLLP